MHPPPALVVERPDQLDLDPAAIAPRPSHGTVLMADPTFFRVDYVINPYMACHVGDVDPERAAAQWRALTEVYRRLGFPVAVLPPVEGLPDLVFSANQALPVRTATGAPMVVLSQMAMPQRRPEVEHFARWFLEAGYESLRLTDPALRFEGMGDAQWWPGRQILLGGHGFRTDAAVYDELALRLGVPILRLQLVDARFYHLDTCLQLLDEDTALYVPEAFDDDGRALLARAFPRLVEVPLEEAVGALACNGYSPDGRHFIVQSGAPETVRRVRDLGLEPIEVDTSEFLKSGGSVYCMKMHLF